MSTFQIGDKVEKIATDYTGGRIGTIVEIGDGKNPNRLRIFWEDHGLRTWCAPHTAKKI